MQVFLLKKPYEVSFSGNPMPFVFAIAPYGQPEKQLELRLMVKVLVEKNYATDVFEEVRSQTFYPDADGMVSFDIHTIVDPFLEFYLPRLTLQKPILAANQRRRYKVSFLLYNSSVAVGTTVESPVLYAIKGGIAYEQWHPTEFFTTLVQDQKQPLRYNTAGEKIFHDETRFLFWLYSANPDYLAAEDGQLITDENGNNIIVNEYTLPLQVVFTITDDAGRKYQYALPTTLLADKWSIGCAPIGFNQVGLQDYLPADALPVSYTVDVRSDANYVVAPVTFILDYRKFYRTYDLLYRNSLGGLDSLRLRGQTDFSADYDRQQAQQIVPPAYYKNVQLLPQVVDSNNAESTKYKGDTGFISREASDKLRDLFLSVQKFSLTDGKLYPVVINNKSTAFYTNRDSLISTLIEWQQAFVNNFYTPKQLMPSTRACPPVESFEVSVLSKNAILIMYSLPIPYDRLQVKISIGTDILNYGRFTYTYTGNTRSIVQTFTLAMEPVFAITGITITANVICDEEGEELSLGPSAVLTRVLPLRSSLIVNDDNYTIDSGQSSYVSLLGSVLANDSDPDGGFLTAVPNAGSTNKGGSFILNADGTVKYLPPSPSFTGADYFIYQVKKVNDTVTATGRVNIQVNPVQTSIFAKLVYRNTVDDNQLPDHRRTSGEIWIDFFSDPAGSQPIDVTPYGLSVNTQLAVDSLLGGVSKIETTLKTYNPTGTKILVYNDEYYFFYLNWLNTNQPAEIKWITSILPGTGYVVI